MNKPIEAQRKEKKSKERQNLFYDISRLAVKDAKLSLWLKKRLRL
jgi:hypothetical protein